MQHEAFDFITGNVISAPILDWRIIFYNEVFLQLGWFRPSVHPSVQDS